MLLPVCQEPLFCLSHYIQNKRFSLLQTPSPQLILPLITQSLKHIIKNHHRQHQQYGFSMWHKCNSALPNSYNSMTSYKNELYFSHIPQFYFFTHTSVRYAPTPKFTFIGLGSLLKATVTCTQKIHHLGVQSWYKTLSVSQILCVAPCLPEISGKYQESPNSTPLCIWKFILCASVPHGAIIEAHHHQIDKFELLRRQCDCWEW